jgi:hypothetical protein
MSLAAKLQIKPGQRVRLVNAPASFSVDAEMARGRTADAILVFVRDSTELEWHESAVLAHAREDRLAWIAYPKAGNSAWT